MGEIDRRGLGVTTSGLLIALLSIILRFAIRLRKRITPGADDWMAFVALIFYAGFCVPTLWVVSQGGLGVEIQEMTPAHAQTAAKAREALADPCLASSG
ncbi:uncharacterized protein BDW70DRAFT_164560 [Aspergillus foveolatus]|uniref:uncharacterized protein n=1 Tax=Aspergillus foveolatus TaxID=210207 RepID=UPI003CCD0DFB